MAFSVQSWSRVSSAANVSLVTLQDGSYIGAPDYFTYITASDNLATIVASGYFNTVAGELDVWDRIYVVGTDGTADLIGLARVLLADPLWPKKALGEIDMPIIQCQSSCSLCLKKVMKGEAVFCSQWPKDRRTRFERATQTIGFKTRRILRYLRQKYIIRDW